MGCCFSKKSSLSPPSIPLSNGVKAPDPIKPMKQVTEPIEESKPKSELTKNTAMEKAVFSEKMHQEDATTKEVFVIKHRRSHERTKKTDSEDSSSASVAVEKEKSNDLAVASVVRVSSCTKEEVDAILIQCGKLSRSNSAAKTRRYSGSKRSFDFDQNERVKSCNVEEDGGEERTHRNRHRGVERVNGSPRERRRRTPSREREDSGKSYRSGSRERGNPGGSGGGSRRVSRSPGKRSETPNLNHRGVSGISVNSSNIRPGKFVTVPATDKSNNGEPSIKRITVKRNIGEACRTAASPRSKSPARAAAATYVQPPPSLSRSSSRKAEQSPYRRNPLGEIDQNSTKVDKIGSCNTNCSKKMINREVESAKPNPKTTIRAASPNRSRSLRKSRDFDFNPETLLSNEDNNNNTTNYTALLLKDIQNFHGKSMSNVDDVSISFNLLPSCVTKACSIVDAVADLNSTTNTDSNQFRFTSTAKKADLMEPSFEKYVTVKRGGGSLEAQESSGSNNLT